MSLLPVTRRELLSSAAIAGLSSLLPGCASSPHLGRRLFPTLDSQREPFLGLATSLTEEYDYEARVEGKIPAGLRGILYRNSAGLFERGNLRKRTMFEGDGLVRAYYFSGDRVRFRCRFVRTEKFVDESEAGRFIYPTFSTQAPGGVLGNFWAGSRIKSQAQISVIARGGRLYAFDESSIPYALDPETLDTIGATDLGAGGAVYSAHPKIDPRTGEWIHFGLHYGRAAELHLTVFDRYGSQAMHRVIRLPRYVHVHDFWATERHLIFNLHPIHVRVFEFLMGTKSLAESFEWRPEEGNLIMIAGRREPSEPVYIEADPSFMWHGINAYEGGGEIIADLVGYKSPDHFLGENAPVYAVMRGEPGKYRDKGELKRYVIDSGRRRLSVESLSDSSGYEWPTANPLNRCYDYRFAYAAKTRGDDFFWSGVSALDVKTGKESVYYFEEGHFCSEPIFAPIPGSGPGLLYGPDIERGWILTEVYDGNRKKSYLAVLRAEGIEGGPVARIHLSHHLPFSMHGFWLERPSLSVT